MAQKDEEELDEFCDYYGSEGYHGYGPYGDWIVEADRQERRMKAEANRERLEASEKPSGPRCTCGAHKTYGEDFPFHADYCELYKGD